MVPTCFSRLSAEGLGSSALTAALTDLPAAASTWLVDEDETAAFPRAQREGFFAPNSDILPALLSSTGVFEALDEDEKRPP